MPSLKPGAAVGGLLLAQAVGAAGDFLNPGWRWGLYNKAGKLIVAHEEEALRVYTDHSASTLSVRLNLSSAVTTAPIEGGKFMSTGKTSNPASGQVMLCIGGTPDNRAQAIAALNAACHGLELYDFRMPERTVENVNVTSVEFSRDARSGVQLLIATVTFQEVMTIAAAKIVHIPPERKSGVAADNGMVQPQPPTPGQAKAVGR